MDIIDRAIANSDIMRDAVAALNGDDEAKASFADRVKESGLIEGYK